ncbi:Spy/CpxP family protein refolding chaperone [Chitinivibrio alkaliphilus]|uniref:Periplasmic heavy metal sensor n=1 Tax=Chitinivibrio alkaliphilus ACht1 TaxID=1313304 RepID=U7DBH1_9BACT|nr:periplasmic heavy metal sensor [Chitinivibrio alkaliphilus]ERP38908.1 hypothetical protein CALK_0395 [Chitinivibrio alkaliphilus ACht1]
MNLLSLSSIVLLVATGSLFAQPPRRSQGRATQRREAFYEELDLSKEQKEAWLSLREERRNHASLAGRETSPMYAYRDSIRMELQKDTPDTARIHAFSEEIGAAHARRTRAMTDYLLAVKEILTPEQFTTLLERQKERAPREKRGETRKKPRRN